MITVQELETAAKEIATLRSECDVKRAELRELDNKLADLENSFMALLEQAEKTSYHSDVGTLSITRRESIKTPKSIEEKMELFNWLTKQGLYWETVSVNSQTLNSLYKREREAAEERGEHFFRIPGLGDPTVSQVLSFRRKNA